MHRSRSLSTATTNRRRSFGAPDITRRICCRAMSVYARAVKDYIDSFNCLGVSACMRYVCVRACVYFPAPDQILYAETFQLLCTHDVPSNIAQSAESGRGNTWVGGLHWKVRERQIVIIRRRNKFEKNVCCGSLGYITNHIGWLAAVGNDPKAIDGGICRVYSDSSTIRILSCFLKTPSNR